MGLCASAHLFIVSQWSFHVYSCEFGVFSRDSDTTTNGQSQPMFEMSQCLLLHRSSVSSATGVGCSSTAFQALDGFLAVKSTDNESAGSAEGRGRKELCNFITLFTHRGQMLYNLLSSSILMPVESLCCIKPQPVEECPFEAAVAQFRAWH